METSADHPMIQALLATDTSCGLAGAPWFSDAAHLSPGGVPSICIGPGSIDQAHSADEFIEIAQEAAEAGLVDDAKFGEIAQAATAKFRENSKVTKYKRFEGQVLTYVHHDKTKGAAVVVEGPATDAVRKVAIQVVASPALVLSKDQLSQELLAKELELETARAIEEGKPENIAKNIAQGRVNKDYVSKVVLLEQPFYIDGKKTVSQYLAEEAKGSKVTDFAYLAVGQE
jgi:translation elongation factor EF-Ts